MTTREHMICCHTSFLSMLDLDTGHYVTFGAKSHLLTGAEGCPEANNDPNHSEHLEYT